MTKPRPKNRYHAIIEKIFDAGHKPGVKSFEFSRTDFEKYARQLRLKPPKNLGDIPYTFRYRSAFPEKITAATPKGMAWIIRPAGRAKYRFVLVPDRPIVPNLNLTATKVPDATPGIVAKYALTDEQALLARVRYNRLTDIFTGVTCYSLQSHLRTTVPDMGQVETDEIYVGIDKRGAHFVFPIQGKGGNDRLNIVQIEQDIAVCAHKLPALICRPLGAQFMDDQIIALFEFEHGEEGALVVSEKHYKLVPPEEISDADLKNYGRRTAD